MELIDLSKEEQYSDWGGAKPTKVAKKNDEQEYDEWGAEPQVEKNNDDKQGKFLVFIFVKIVMLLTNCNFRRRV